MNKVKNWDGKGREVGNWRSVGLKIEWFWKFKGLSTLVAQSLLALTTFFRTSLTLLKFAPNYYKKTNKKMSQSLSFIYLFI